MIDNDSRERIKKSVDDKLYIPEGLHGLSLVRKAVQELKYQIGLRDIMSPTVPEYVEHHESIQEILNFTEDVLEIIDREMLEECCEGVCDRCPYSAILPGTGERIDREPEYICTLFN